MKTGYITVRIWASGDTQLPLVTPADYPHEVVAAGRFRGPHGRKGWDMLLRVDLDDPDVKGRVDDGLLLTDEVYEGELGFTDDEGDPQ